VSINGGPILGHQNHIGEFLSDEHFHEGFHLDFWAWRANDQGKRTIHFTDDCIET
jgi:hypothetical protein